MIRNFIVFTLLVSTSLGLRQARQGRAIPNVNVLRSTSNKATTVSPLKIDVVSRGLELTDALRNRIDGKIGKVLNKLASPPGVVSSQLVLRVHKQKAEEAHSHTTKANSQICELTVVMKGGRVIHSTERSSDMYQSIDVLSHKLAMKLKAAKDKVQDKRGNAKVGGSVAEDEESGGEDLNDEELLMDIDKDYRTKYLSSIPPPLQVDLSAIKKKVYTMAGIDVAQAVESLNYVDHPFFVFRNKETNEVNVVYRKEDGGVGHIAPEP